MLLCSNLHIHAKFICMFIDTGIYNEGKDGLMILRSLQLFSGEFKKYYCISCTLLLPEALLFSTIFIELHYGLKKKPTTTNDPNGD